MKNLILIAAVGKNRELGKDNDLIWRFKEDLGFFRTATMGHCIVMGRKTQLSLPPNLKNRRYLVISETDFGDEGVTFFRSIPAFLEFAGTCPEDIYVIGGGSVYAQLLPHCDKLILTEIDSTAPADVFFPEFDKKKYTAEVIGGNSENGVSYKRVVYTRK